MAYVYVPDQMPPQQPGPYQMVALHGMLNINKALTLKTKHEIALILQGDNLLNEQLWVPALGNPATDTVGLLVTQPRQFSQTATTITDSAEIPVRGPTWVSGGEYFEANDAIANDMFINGVVTDTTAGSASVSWSFVPAPGR